mgnify:CR=1 FL=1
MSGEERQNLHRLFSDIESTIEDFMDNISLINRDPFNNNETLTAVAFELIAYLNKEHSGLIEVVKEKFLELTDISLCAEDEQRVEK